MDLKSNKGITLITLTVTIVVMMILSFTVTVNVSSYFERKRKTNFETDITRLREKIDNYYNKNNSLPIINKYTNTDMLNKNVNDNENYYVIDLNAIEDLSLNYGSDFTQITDTSVEINDLLDIYIINEQSHVIYYPQGIKYFGNMLYTSEGSGNIQINGEQISEVQITGNNNANLGETIQLTAKVIPTFVENTGVTWSSSDTNIATIDENGLVTTKKDGKVTITATSKDNTSIAANYEITINFVTYYDNPYIPADFIHTEGTWNSGYVIKQASTGNEFVWVPCVTEQSKVKSGDTVVTFGKITTGKYNSSNYGLLPTDTTVTKEDESVTEIKNSVENYQGFYIARYEAGIEGTTISTTTNDTIKQDLTQKPVSKPNVGVWNYITRTNAITVSKAMVDKTTTGVNSTLISGEAWDTTLAWISKTDSTYAENSAEKGNYTGTIAKTANSVDYTVNNIYDMAGNVWEWTTENSMYKNNSYLIYRGGDYSCVGSDSSAAYRTSITNVTNKFVGFRVVLYM